MFRHISSLLQFATQKLKYINQSFEKKCLTKAKTSLDLVPNNERRSGHQKHNYVLLLYFIDIFYIFCVFVLYVLNSFPYFHILFLCPRFYSAIVFYIVSLFDNGNKNTTENGWLIKDKVRLSVQDMKCQVMEKTV